MACHVEVDFTYAKCFSKDENLSAWVLICVTSTYLDESIQGAAKKNNSDETYSLNRKQAMWLHGWSMTHLYTVALPQS